MIFVVVELLDNDVDEVELSDAMLQVLLQKTIILVDACLLTTCSIMVLRVCMLWALHHNIVVGCCCSPALLHVFGDVGLVVVIIKALELDGEC